MNKNAVTLLLALIPSSDHFSAIRPCVYAFTVFFFLKVLAFKLSAIRPSCNYELINACLNKYLRATAKYFYFKNLICKLNKKVHNFSLSVHFIVFPLAYIDTSVRPLVSAL